MSVIIKTNNLTKVYNGKFTAVDRLNIEIEEGGNIWPSWPKWCSNVTILKLEPDKYCVYRGGKISI